MLNRIAVSGFQFHKVRLKGSGNSASADIMKFQFHKVRLKVGRQRNESTKDNVSIP